MSCYDIVVLQLTHSLKHLVEFQITVTVNTWIRCAAMLIGIYKAIHNILLESLREIKNIIFNSHSVADTSGIFYIIQRTASLLSFNSNIFIVKQFHSSTDALVTGFLCQQSCYRAVYSATHCNNSFLHFLFHPILINQQNR